jgi:hypothetical protein
MVGVVVVAEEAVGEDAVAIDDLYLLLTIVRIIKWIPNVNCRCDHAAYIVNYIQLHLGIFSHLVTSLSVFLVILFVYHYLTMAYGVFSCTYLRSARFFSSEASLIICMVVGSHYDFLIFS